MGEVIEVNLSAPERITRELLDESVVRDNGRIIGVVDRRHRRQRRPDQLRRVEGRRDRPRRRLADELGDGITVNAVAPGFIKTAMTAAMPFVIREVGRRLDAMSQGGLPVDVAETIAWYASPGSTPSTATSSGYAAR